MRYLLSTVVFLVLSTTAWCGEKRAAVLAGLPGPLEWQNEPSDWRVDNEAALSITAGKNTDWFVSPSDGARHDTSPRLLFRPAQDFVLSAKLTVDFQSQWDGGVLVLYANDTLWAKLGIEKTIEQHPAVVSVVTRTLSDDNNSIAIHGSSVYLKIAKAPQAIFFYASEDGEKWSIIRAFSLGQVPDLRAGFSSQSPIGERCTTVFSDIRYVAKRVNLWTGD